MSGSSITRIAVTGAAGQIAYALLFRIASGEMLGQDRPIALQLLEIPPALPSLRAVVMELEDCAYPLLREVTVTDDPAEAFREADYALLVGSRPRSQGMERRDLLEANGQIFRIQGQALNAHASREVRVLIVGNPANTNALICMSNAPDLAPEQFSAMTRLDHNRTVCQLSRHLGAGCGEVTRVAVWGNHSPTMYPDISHALVGGRPARDLIDPTWAREVLIPAIQQRGAEILAVRGMSSAASAALAALDHMHDWMRGTPPGDWTSMAVVGDGSYDVSSDLVSSFPVTTAAGRHTIVPGLELDELGTTMLARTLAELKEERDAVRHLIP